ncbi:hypothetical protein [Streptomyces niveus]|uniref:hypothetical protein n=1 Tax=Streptomyces niveus TaxID=193462 RepID=UPI00133183E3|nr:hypothetical protein [Streptomyces niveus]
MNFEQILGVTSAVAGVGSLALQIVETLRKRREGNRDPEVSFGGAVDAPDAAGDNQPESEDGSGGRKPGSAPIE